MVATFQLLLSYIFILFPHVSFGSDNAIVEIEFGVRIRGSQMTTLNQQNFLAFHGIPYAEPPVGELRFKPPVPKQWKKKLFDAREIGPWCIQQNIPLFTHKEMFGQEDCLILNVYTHNLEEPLRKVMVFIHGGAFVMGSSNQYGPRRLLDRNVVLVIINYRVGPFGFLSTMDKSSPGNYGLLDQTEALKWVKRNIAAFGGNPNKVTIFGESAGSASVISHIISPLSSGLFHRAIGQSGTVLNTWAEQTNPMKWTKLMAEKVGCDRSSTEELVECLRKLSAEKIHQAANEINNFGAFTVFGITADGNFHSHLPSELLRNGLIANKIPLLLGVTRDEGLLFVPSVYSKSDDFSEQLLRKLAVMTLNIKPEQVTSDLIHMIEKQYFTIEDTKDEKRLVEAMGKVLSDGKFKAGHYKTVQFLLETQMDLFLYSHDYITNHSVLKLVGLRDYKGVGHSDDLFCLLDSPFLFPEDYQKPNDKIESNFLDIWTSFADNGYPMEDTADGIIKWRPSTFGHAHIYHMDREIKMKNYDAKNDWRLDFWLRKIPLILHNSESVKEEL